MQRPTSSPGRRRARSRSRSRTRTGGGDDTGVANSTSRGGGPMSPIPPLATRTRSGTATGGRDAMGETNGSAGGNTGNGNVAGGGMSPSSSSSTATPRGKHVRPKKARPGSALVERKHDLVGFGEGAYPDDRSAHVIPVSSPHSAPPVASAEPRRNYSNRSVGGTGAVYDMYRRPASAVTGTTSLMSTASSSTSTAADGVEYRREYLGAASASTFGAGAADGPRRTASSASRGSPGPIGPDGVRRRKGFMLLIDTSNSMLKRVDPETGLPRKEADDSPELWTTWRVEALERTILRLLDFLEPDDYLGAVAFDAGVSGVLPFRSVGQHTDITVDAAREMWEAQNEALVASDARGGKNTDFRQVLEIAVQTWLDAVDSPRDLHVIMLTDMHPRPVCSTSLDLARGIRTAIEDILAQVAMARPSGRAFFHFLLYAPSVLPFAEHPRDTPLPPGSVHITDGLDRHEDADAFIRGILGLTYVRTHEIEKLRPLFTRIRRRTMFVYGQMRERYGSMEMLPADYAQQRVQLPTTSAAVDRGGITSRGIDRDLGLVQLPSPMAEIPSALDASSGGDWPHRHTETLIAELKRMGDEALARDAEFAAAAAEVRERLRAEFDAAMAEAKRGDRAFARTCEDELAEISEARERLERDVEECKAKVLGSEGTAADIAAVAAHLADGACGRRWDALELEMEMLRVRMTELEARRPMGHVSPENQLEGARGRVDRPTYDPENDRSFKRLQGSGGGVGVEENRGAFAPFGAGSGGATPGGSGGRGTAISLVPLHTPRGAGGNQLSMHEQQQQGASSSMILSSNTHNNNHQHSHVSSTTTMVMHGNGKGNGGGKGGDGGAAAASGGNGATGDVGRWVDTLTVGKAVTLALIAFLVLLFVMFLGLLLYHYSIARRTPESTEARFAELELRLAAAESGVATVGEHVHVSGTPGVVNLAADPALAYDMSMDPRYSATGALRVRRTAVLENGIDLVSYAPSSTLGVARAQERPRSADHNGVRKVESLSDPTLSSFVRSRNSREETKKKKKKNDGMAPAATEYLAPLQTATSSANVSKNAAGRAESRAVTGTSRIAMGLNGTLELRPGTSGLVRVNGSAAVAGALSASTLSAGSVNTGQGNNRIFPMDQPVRTGDTPSFAGIAIGASSGSISFSNPSGPNAAISSPAGASAAVRVTGSAEVTSGLTVRGTATVEGASLDARSSLTVNGTLVHADATTQRVGVGTSTPSSLLHVAGAVTIDGQLVVNGQVAAFGVSARDAVARSICFAGLAAGLGGAGTGGAGPRSLTAIVRPYSGATASVASSCSTISPAGFYFACGVARPGFGLLGSPIGPPGECGSRLESDLHSSFVRASEWEQYKSNVTQCSSANVMVCCSPQCQGW